eukprot:TRINITY_DN3217_c1_g1_i1.p1 TRINITY_DN3217_c1_g1~~TRINITY_DN3217_c1_g1_i1.p1  ORF type:complete len:2165 (+),score=595.72 TRINITY_DN3217_c1_g1_i1:76-6570(+)
MAAPDLGPDWMVGTGEDGTPYYLHLPTDQMYWSLPDGVLPQSTQPAGDATREPFAADPFAHAPPEQVDPLASRLAPKVKPAEAQKLNPTVSAEDAEIRTADSDMWAMPPGWERSYDASTRKAYFIDRENEITTWDHPLIAEAKPLAEKSLVPFGWEAARDTDGSPYYIHLGSGTTSWHHPNTKMFAKQLSDDYKRQASSISRRAPSATQQAVPTPAAEGSVQQYSLASQRQQHQQQMRAMQQQQQQQQSPPRDYTDYAAQARMLENQARESGQPITRNHRAQKEALRTLKERARAEEADIPGMLPDVLTREYEKIMMNQPQDDEPQPPTGPPPPDMWSDDEGTEQMMQQDPLDGVNLENIKDRIMLALKKERRAMRLPNPKYCDELSEIMEDIMNGRALQLRKPDLFQTVSVKRIVYENWQPLDIANAVVHNEFLLGKYDPAKLDLHFAVGVHLDVTVLSSTVMVMLGQCWRTEDQYDIALYRERRERRQKITGQPPIPLTWDSFDEVLAEEAAYIRKLQGLESTFPASLKLNLFQLVERDNGPVCALLPTLTHQKVDVLIFPAGNIEHAMAQSLKHPLLRMAEDSAKGITHLRFACVRLATFLNDPDEEPTQTVRLCAQWRGSDVANTLQEVEKADMPQAVGNERKRLAKFDQLTAQQAAEQDSFDATTAAAAAVHESKPSGPSPVAAVAPVASDKARADKVSEMSNLEQEMQELQMRMARMQSSFRGDTGDTSPSRFSPSHSPQRTSDQQPTAVQPVAPVPAAPVPAPIATQPIEQLPQRTDVTPRPAAGLVHAPVLLSPSGAAIPAETLLVQAQHRLQTIYEQCNTDPDNMPRYEDVQLLRKKVEELNRENHTLLCHVKFLRSHMSDDCEEPLGGQLLEGERSFVPDREEARLPEDFQAARAQYGMLLRALQNNPGYLARIVSACSMTQQDQILPIITKTLLGCYSADESLIVTFAVQAIREHFKRFSYQQYVQTGELVPAVSDLSRTLSALVQREPCVIFARKIFEKGITDLLSSERHDLEIDPQRIAMAQSNLSREQVQQLIDLRIPLLQAYLETLCDGLVSHPPKAMLPDSIVRIACVMSEEAEAWSEGLGERGLVELLWDLFLLPCIDSPVARGIVDPFTKTSPTVKRNLQIIRQMMYYMVRPITSFSGGRPAEVQVDPRAGNVSEQMAIVGLLNGPMHDIFERFQTAFKAHRTRIMSSATFTKPSMAVMDDNAAPEASGLVAVGLYEVVSIHDALASRPVHLVPPQSVATVLDQLGPSPNYSPRELASFFVLQLGNVGGAEEENPSQMNQLARMQLGAARKALSGQITMDLNRMQTLVTGLEQCKPYLVLWAKVTKELQRAYEVLANYNTEISEMLRNFKRAFQRGMVEKMSRNITPTSTPQHSQPATPRGGVPVGFPAASPVVPLPSPKLPPFLEAQGSVGRRPPRPKPTAAPAGVPMFDASSRRYADEDDMSSPPLPTMLPPAPVASSAATAAKPVVNSAPPPASIPPPPATPPPAAATPLAGSRAPTPTSVTGAAVTVTAPAVTASIASLDDSTDSAIPAPEYFTVENELYHAVRSGYVVPQYTPEQWEQWEEYRIATFQREIAEHIAGLQERRRQKAATRSAAEQVRAQVQQQQLQTQGQSVAPSQQRLPQMPQQPSAQQLDYQQQQQQQRHSVLSIKQDPASVGAMDMQTPPRYAPNPFMPSPQLSTNPTVAAPAAVAQPPPQQHDFQQQAQPQQQRAPRAGSPVSQMSHQSKLSVAEQQAYARMYAQAGMLEEEPEFHGQSDLDQSMMSEMDYARQQTFEQPLHTAPLQQQQQQLPMQSPGSGYYQQQPQPQRVAPAPYQQLPQEQPSYAPQPQYQQQQQQSQYGMQPQSVRQQLYDPYTAMPQQALPVPVQPAAAVAQSPVSYRFSDVQRQQQQRMALQQQLQAPPTPGGSNPLQSAVYQTRNQPFVDSTAQSMFAAPQPPVVQQYQKSAAGPTVPYQQPAADAYQQSPSSGYPPSGVYYPQRRDSFDSHGSYVSGSSYVAPAPAALPMQSRRPLPPSSVPTTPVTPTARSWASSALLGKPVAPAAAVVQQPSAESPRSRTSSIGSQGRLAMATGPAPSRPAPQPPVFSAPQTVYPQQYTPTGQQGGSGYIVQQTRGQQQQPATPGGGLGALMQTRFAQPAPARTFGRT